MQRRIKNETASLKGGLAPWAGRSVAPIVMLTELADNTIKPRRINRRFKVRWTQKNLRQRHTHTHWERGMEGWMSCHDWIGGYVESLFMCVWFLCTYAFMLHPHVCLWSCVCVWSGGLLWTHKKRSSEVERTETLHSASLTQILACVRWPETPSAGGRACFGQEQKETPWWRVGRRKSDRWINKGLLGSSDLSRE